MESREESVGKLIDEVKVVVERHTKLSPHLFGEKLEIVLIFEKDEVDGKVNFLKTQR